MGYVASLFKPLLTILVTVVGAVFITAVASPTADGFIEGHLPVWSQIDPVIDIVRDWLGIHQPEPPAEPESPWWKFWVQAASANLG